MNDLHYGVCVGINRYPAYPDRELAFARADALAFREWLVAPDGGELPTDNAKMVMATETYIPWKDAYKPFAGPGKSTHTRRAWNRAYRRASTPSSASRPPPATHASRRATPTSATNASWATTWRPSAATRATRSNPRMA